MAISWQISGHIKNNITDSPPSSSYATMQYSIVIYSNIHKIWSKGKFMWQFLFNRVSINKSFLFNYLFPFTRRLRKRLSKSSAHLCVLKYLTILSIFSTEIWVKRSMSSPSRVCFCIMSLHAILYSRARLENIRTRFVVSLSLDMA